MPWDELEFVSRAEGWLLLIIIVVVATLIISMWEGR